MFSVPDTNVSSSLSEEDNYTSQIGWLLDPDTNASAEISVESHSNKTVTRWLPAPDISAPVTAKGCVNSSSETDMLPTADSKVLSAKLSKESGNYSTIETNPFTSVDRNMFTAMMSRNNSGFSQTNLSPSPRNNISAAINTQNYFNVSKRNWLPLQGSNISVDITISDINNYTSETLWLLAPTNNTFNEKNVHSIVPLSSKTTSTNLSSNFNKHCASLRGLFAASLLLFCLNHISDFCVSI
ncbi:hypothetical protein R5R35_004960 [Gryllus longicercus]|uniref:Uncharacterized protein n=1 Tax=Gryllus longicercus TaxID=2509291 RepID=A0AAN9V1B0_9ORTH